MRITITLVSLSKNDLNACFCQYLIASSLIKLPNGYIQLRFSGDVKTTLYLYLVLLYSLVVLHIVYFSVLQRPFAYLYSIFVCILRTES